MNPGYNGAFGTLDKPQENHRKMEVFTIEIVVFPNKTSIYHGFMMIIPSGYVKIAIENDHI